MLFKSLGKKREREAKERPRQLVIIIQHKKKVTQWMNVYMCVTEWLPSDMLCLGPDIDTQSHSWHRTMIECMCSMHHLATSEVFCIHRDGLG